jgi:hypothetical protein
VEGEKDMFFIITYFFIVFLVIEIAVSLMRSTGLKYEVARFQVISMLTSTGFTTKESELILGHPIRRRLGMFLILFGLFSFAVIISSISSILNSELRTTYFAIIPVVLAIILYVLRLPQIEPRLKKKLNATMEQKFEITELSINEVLLHSEEDTLIDIPIGQNSSKADQTFSDLWGNDKDINLLFIARGTEVVRRECMKTKFIAGDILYVYGSKNKIKSAFSDELRAKEDQLADGSKTLSRIKR